jgi:hypothetical protein
MRGLTRLAGAASLVDRPVQALIGRTADGWLKWLAEASCMRGHHMGFEELLVLPGCHGGK